AFCNAGGVLFGVKDYVPALMEYVKKYEVKLEFFHNLVAVDGPAKTATFEVKEPGKEPRRVEMKFDMMHVCPPQTAPDFIRVSPLRSEEHTSELQSRENLVCRLLLEKKKS